MIVDSSVWVEFLGRRPTAVARAVRDFLAAGGNVTLTATILQEVLQGSRDKAQLEALERVMAVFPMYEPVDVRRAAREAGALYARCRWQGITIRSPNDCLIAVSAIESGKPLMARDRDFVHLRTLDPRLQLVDIPSGP